MIVYKKISEIENNRKRNLPLRPSCNVSVQSKIIFNDLASVLEDIDGFRDFYIRLFEDMDRFDFLNISSVPDAKDFDLIASDYEHIKLYEHTINVFTQMSKLVKNSKEYESQKDIFLLLALLHDFGKSEPLCNHYKINLEQTHWVRSAEYFSIIAEHDIKGSMDSTGLKIIEQTLRWHHSILSETQRKNKFLVALKAADSEARRSEKEKSV